MSKIYKSKSMVGDKNSRSEIYSVDEPDDNSNNLLIDYDKGVDVDKISNLTFSIGDWKSKIQRYEERVKEAEQTLREKEEGMKHEEESDEAAAVEQNKDDTSQKS